MEPYLNFGVFKELQDVELLNTAQVSFQSVAWDTGADFDPEVLYEKGQSAHD